MAGDPNDLPEADVRRALEEGLDKIRAYLRSRLGDPNHADEVLQAFCARALERAGDLKEGGAARSWLSRVLATAIADHYRGLARQRASEAPAEDLSSIAAETEADSAVCACLLALLDALSAQDAALIRAIDIEGRDRASVAATLGLNLNALTVRLHRARARLRALVLRLCAVCVIHGFGDCECPPPNPASAEG